MRPGGFVEIGHVTSRGTDSKQEGPPEVVEVIEPGDDLDVPHIDFREPYCLERTVQSFGLAYLVSLGLLAITRLSAHPPHRVPERAQEAHPLRVIPHIDTHHTSRPHDPTPFGQSFLRVGHEVERQPADHHVEVAVLERRGRTTGHMESSPAGKPVARQLDEGWGEVDAMDGVRN